MPRPPALYLERVGLNADTWQEGMGYPGNMLWLPELDLRFTTPVTFFVGENGSGKSTLIEALAEKAGLPSSGGGRQDMGATTGPDDQSALAPYLRTAFRARTRVQDAYFFRAEFVSHFAGLLDQRKVDPDFRDSHGPADPYVIFGGKSLREQSHGESFLSTIFNRIGSGLYFMDEPESALSPQRQLGLLVHLHDVLAMGETQLIIATHSPLLLTFPGATIMSFDGGTLQSIALEETSHYQISRGMLLDPALYWKHLLKPTDDAS